MQRTTEAEKKAKNEARKKAMLAEAIKHSTVLGSSKSADRKGGR